MKVQVLTGCLLVVVPLMFNIVFFLLRRTFDYPDILRRPVGEILTRFQAGGAGLIASWYLFVLSALLFMPLALLVPRVLVSQHPFFAASIGASGLLAGLVQVLGLIRWPFIVPYLAREYLSPDAAPATRDAVTVVFQAFHRYAGVAVGEHLGYLFTSAWTALVAVAMTTSPLFPAWLGWIGLVPAAGIFIGLFEEAGFEPAAPINAASYILWSMWLVAIGIILIVS